MAYRAANMPLSAERFRFVCNKILSYFCNPDFDELERTAFDPSPLAFSTASASSSHFSFVSVPDYRKKEVLY
jgi:hypothetical protein